MTARIVDSVLVLGDLPPLGAPWSVEVRGYACAWNVAAGTPHAQAWRRGSFAATFTHPRRKRVPIWLQHDPTRVIGTAIEFSEDDHGLHLCARIAPAHGRQILQELLAGELGGMSVGVVYRIANGAVVGDVWLKEVSLVRTPGNPGARIDTIVIGKAAASREPSPHAWRRLTGRTYFQPVGDL